MSEDMHAGTASQADRQAEMMRSFGEQPVPPVEELIQGFQDRRKDLQMKLRDLQGQSGFALDILQAQERRKRIAECQMQLSELDDLWQTLGGSEIDEARKQVSSLDFKSGAMDHVSTRGNLGQAKEVFYGNFVALHEEALAHESNEGDLDEPTSNGSPGSDAEEYRQSEAVDAQEYGSGKQTKKSAAVELSDTLKDGWALSKTVQRLHEKLDQLREQHGRLTDKSGPDALQSRTEIKNTIKELDAAQQRLDEFTEAQDKDLAEPLDDSTNDEDALLAEAASWTNGKLNGDNETALLSEAASWAGGKSNKDKDEDALLAEAAAWADERSNGDDSKLLAEAASWVKPKNEQASAEVFTQEQVAQREEQKAAAEQSVLETTQGADAYEKYHDCLAEYGRYAAEVAIKDSRIGRRKREEALRVAQENLTAAHLAYVKLIDDARNKQGMYEDFESKEIADQARSDDFFDHFRQLQAESRQAAVTARLDQVQNRNIIQRGLVKMGDWLNGGKTNTRNWLRTAGTGAGVGTLVATGAILSGIGWPVTAASTIGAGFAARYGSKMSVLDKFLDEQLGANADSEHLKEIYDTAYSHTEDQDTVEQRLSRGIFEEIREKSDKELAVAKRQANQTGKRFGIGVAAGGTATHLGHALSNMLDGGGHDVAAAQSADTDNSHSNGTGNDNLRPNENNHNMNRDHVSVNNGPAKNPENIATFINNLNISHGEGWMHQFQDMGLTANQAENLAQDQQFMQGLEKLGAAYYDNSIGGWGINMPSNGHLSPEVGEFIHQQVVEHGYVK